MHPLKTTLIALGFIATSTAAFAEDDTVSLSDICPDSGCVTTVNVQIADMIGRGFFHDNQWNKDVVGFTVVEHPDMMFSIDGVPGALFPTAEAAAEFATFMMAHGVSVDVLDGDKAPGS